MGAQGRAERRRACGRTRGEHGRGARQASTRRAQASQGCALGALSLFFARFDSVLFLSQFLDVVRELGS